MNNFTAYKEIKNTEDNNDLDEMSAKKKGEHFDQLMKNDIDIDEDEDEDEVLDQSKELFDGNNPTVKIHLYITKEYNALINCIRLNQ